jgi:predicted CXXCH cytochrome family protein
MNNRSLLVLSGMAIFAITVYSGCTKMVGKEPKKVEIPIEACDTITYTKHIAPIMTASCVSCHSSSFSQGGVLLTSYSEVKAQADNGKLNNVIFVGTPEFMPQGGPQLSQSQKDRIKCWLNNGKKEN